MTKQKWKWPWQKPEPVEIRPPKVGGTRAPSQVETIDFSKPHDFHFRLGGHESVVVFENCLLVGFTTPMTDDAPSPQWEEYSHNRWIVLKRSDGRHVYISRDYLLYIEDSRSGT